MDHIGIGFTGLYFSDQEKLPPEVLEAFSQLRAIDKYFVPLVISKSSLSQNSIQVIEDPGGDIFAGYGARNNSFYLLRPDRHIAARWTSIELTEAQDALQKNLGVNPQ